MYTTPFANFPRRCNLLFALLLVSAFTACGGLDEHSVTASNSLSPMAVSLTATATPQSAVTSSTPASATAVDEFSHPSSPQLTELTSAATGAAVQTSASIATATTLIGTVIEFAPSSPKLSLGQFSDEVRAAMNALESQVGLALQWHASFHSNKRSSRAYVTVVAAGREQLPTVADMNTSTNGLAYATASSSFVADSGPSPLQMKEALCAGGSAATYEQYYAATAAYHAATEAMAVGLPAGSDSGAVNDRMNQLYFEETHMSDDQIDFRREARMAIREQRHKALRQCRES